MAFCSLLRINYAELAGTYRVPNCAIEVLRVYTNTVPCGHMRAPGAPVSADAVQPALRQVTDTLLRYVIGPWSIGAQYATYDSQGAQQLTGVTQRHENVFYAAGSYAVAPGMTAFLDYTYGTRYQGQFNFATGGVGGGPAYNHVQAQGVMLGTSVKW